MHVSRFVSLVSKKTLSQLSGRVAPVLWAPCRTITTRQDHVRFLKFGPKKKVDKTDVTRRLDVFLGDWVSDTKRAQEYAEYMSERDKAELNMWEKHENKPFHSFSRTNGDWTVQSGVEGGDLSVTYNFKLGHPFLYTHKEGTMVKLTVLQDIRGMVWVYRALSKPEHVYSTHMMVKEYTLFINKVYPDGTAGFKVFFKKL